MLPKIQKILYATDLSPNTAYVFRYAINTAIKHDAEIFLLHVIEEMPASARILIDLELCAHEGTHNERTERNGIDYVDKIKKRLEIFVEKELKDQPEALDRVISIEVHEGYSAHEILKKAKELNCDLIIMGSHGKGLISHAFLGSVAERVLKRTKMPVLIVPLPDEITEITFQSI
ncbi:universal stress protein [Candidatus Babeliales bacterium]|nr:universal stress protein [Candidatus Babeliales bacterium]